VHPDPEDIIERLRPFGSPERAVQEKRYLKSELDFLGVPLPDLRRVVTAAVREYRDLGHDELAGWAEALWREPLWESRMPLAGDIAGRIALRHPLTAWPVIDPWANDADFWVRRSALLSLLPGIRAGQPDLERLNQYATSMLGEKEFFIRKAIGWVLRELSKKDAGYVTTWTERHLAEMSGVTFREAVRRLPEPDAARLRAGFTAGRSR
jgi:hypothetical protein